MSCVDYDIDIPLSKTKLNDVKTICGHSRLITNGLADGVRDGAIVLHNGIRKY